MKRALLLLAIVPLLMGQDYNVPFNPQAAAAGGTDLTALSSAVGCWFVTAGNTNDQCSNGAAHNLSTNGTTISFGTDGSIDYAVYESANGECHWAADHSELDAAGTAFTFLAFVYPVTVCTETCVDTIAGKELSDDQWILHTAFSGTGMRADISNEVGELGATGLTATTWHMWGMTWSPTAVTGGTPGDVVELLYDGIEDCSGACEADTGGTTGNGARMGIGARFCNFADDQFFNGRIGEVMWFTESLTYAQICSYCRFGPRGDWADRGAGACNSCSL